MGRSGGGITTGIDLVHVPRIARSVTRSARTFLDRAFTPAEQEVCAGDPARLAGRWAAKEAVLKALGRGIGEIPMTDIEVLRAASGAPVLHLAGRAAAAAQAGGWGHWSVSISHDGEYATAVAVALAARG
jgi:holo-[acyl-carrier protein] synthase